MNKTQRDYAIKRASSIITSKTPTPKWEGNLDTQYVLSVLDLEYVRDHKATYCADYIKAHHADFAEYRERLAEYNSICNDILRDRKSAIQTATDFIMLGDEAEVLEYLKNLE